MDAAIDRIAQSTPSLMAIDGLPCGGKSTLAERLRARLDGDCLHLDEFVLPKRDWPEAMKPAFPFEYIRYAAFMEAVRTLATVGAYSFNPFDWGTCQVSPHVRTITRDRPLIIEGVSSLNPQLCALFDVRVFVESDRSTTLHAAVQRGVGPWEHEWREVFLPSADLYMATQPQHRADVLVMGRGVS